MLPAVAYWANELFFQQGFGRWHRSSLLYRQDHRMTIGRDHCLLAYAMLAPG